MKQDAAQKSNSRKALPIIALVLAAFALITGFFTLIFLVLFSEFRQSAEALANAAARDEAVHSRGGGYVFVALFSLIYAFIPFAVQILETLAAVVLSVISVVRKNNSRKLSVAACVLSGIALAVCVAFWIYI